MTGSWRRTAPAGCSRRTLGLAPQGESVGLGGSLSGLAWDRLVLAFPGARRFLPVDLPAAGRRLGGHRLDRRAAHRTEPPEPPLDAFLDRWLPAGWRDLPGPALPLSDPGLRPLDPARRAPALGSRLLLAGDAAALADPLTREGIRYGLLSGRWAAESLLAGRPDALPGAAGGGAGRRDGPGRPRPRPLLRALPSGSGWCPVAASTRASAGSSAICSPAASPIAACGGGWCGGERLLAPGPRGGSGGSGGPGSWPRRSAVGRSASSVSAICVEEARAGRSTG